MLPSELKRPCVIFDLDGTIANIEHRRAYIVPAADAILGWKKNWQAFRRGIPGDTPNKAVRFIYDLLAPTETALLFVSGRYEEERELTEQWLTKHGYVHYVSLFMREDGDNRSDDIIKREIYERHIEPYYDVRVVFDDRDRVVAMWRSLGLSCFQVAPRDF